MNKKAMAQFGIFLIFVVALLVFMYLSGSISGFLVRNTLKNIPIWFWVGLVFFVLIILRRKK